MPDVILMLIAAFSVVLSLLFVLGAKDSFEKLSSLLLTLLIFFIIGTGTLIWLIVAWKSVEIQESKLIPLMTASDGKNKYQFVDIGKPLRPEIVNINERFKAVFPEKSFAKISIYKSWSCGVYITPNPQPFISEIVTPDSPEYPKISPEK